MENLVSVCGRSVLVVLAVVATSCGGDDESSAEGGGSAAEGDEPSVDGWGPLAVVKDGGASDGALIAGTLVVTESCVLLDERGEPVLLVWPDSHTEWDAAAGTVRYTRAGGDGDAVSFGGGGSSISEGGPSAEEFLASIDWVAEPHSDCVADTSWFIGDLVE